MMKYVLYHLRRLWSASLNWTRREAVGDKPKMSYTEEQSLDATACYQFGKIARQRGIPFEQNPWEQDTEFARFWSLGWTDEDTLSKGIML
jgi:hypothetical protein